MKRINKQVIIAAEIVVIFLVFIFFIIPGGSLEAEVNLNYLDHNPYIYWKIKPGTQKALYISGCSAGSEEKRREIYRLIGETELNSIVFDVKDDYGYIDYDTDVRMAKEIGADKNYYDLDLLIKEMDRRGIYGIARFVVFKDRVLPEARPEFSIMDSRTGLPLYSEGSYWPDIYCEEVWDYYIEIIKELASRGIKEIQFDYIRAPARGNTAYAEYTHNNENNTKVLAITNFLKKVREETADYNIKISADVFGWVFIVENDQGIGQLLEELVPYLDYIYPMPYPSHYSQNFLGHSLPEEYPYEVVSYTLKKGISRINNSGYTGCEIIPWIQAFSLKVKYTEKEIIEQIEAAKDLKIEGYLCWNAANKYEVVEKALK